MTTAGFDFSSIDGALTPDQAAEALATAGSGDTGEQPDTGGAPTTTPETSESGDAGEHGTKDTGEKGTGAPAAAGESEIDPAKAVVMARDGIHTIPYERLAQSRQEAQQAREGEQHWKAQAEAAQQQLAELQAQAQARVDAGQTPTKTDNMVATAEAAIEAGVDAGVFGDFSEEALAAGIQKLVAQQVAAQVQAHVGKALAPVQAKHQEDAATAHYSAIYGKHPDADSIAQSNEFAAWVNAQPSAVRAAYWGLFDAKTGGTADQIVEVFDAFKASSTPSKPATAAASTQEAAKAALATAKTEPPSSLSSIPGGRAAGASVADATADMSGVEMMQATAGMSPAQIEAWLNQQI